MRRSEVIDDPQCVGRVARCLPEGHEQGLVSFCASQSLGAHNRPYRVISRPGVAYGASLASDTAPDLSDRTAAVIQSPDLLQKERVQAR